METVEESRCFHSQDFFFELLIIQFFKPSFSTMTWLSGSIPFIEELSVEII